MIRYDVSDLRVSQLRRMVTLRSGGLCVIVYTASLLLTLSTGQEELPALIPPPPKKNQESFARVGTQCPAGLARHQES